MTMNLFPTKAKKDELLTRLKMLGVSIVQVEFRGGGDSGEIEGAYAKDLQNNFVDIKEEKMLWPTMESYEEDGKWHRRMVDKDMPIEDILKDMTEQWLEDTGHDWYNNDGGQGEMTIDFKQSPPEFSMYVGVNYNKTDDYNYSLDEDDEEYDDNEEE
jgi:hypothetical protein